MFDRILHKPLKITDEEIAQNWARGLFRNQLNIYDEGFLRK